MPAGLRKDQPSRFLDASLVSLENALLSRADELEKPGEFGEHGVISTAIAEEFRKLAAELHHW